VRVVDESITFCVSPRACRSVVPRALPDGILPWRAQSFLSRRRPPPERASALGVKSRRVSRTGAVYTDQYAVGAGVLPPARPRATTQGVRRTTHVERFNGTLRQRVSRLVRAALSLSKTLTDHIGAIQYCVCH
jgi:hypothetical protein